MATVEDFKLRIKVEGEGDIKKVTGTVSTLKGELAAMGDVGGPLGGTINSIVSKLGPLGVAASLAATAFAALGGAALRIAGEISDISGATGIAAGQLMNFKTSIIEAGGKADDFTTIAAKLNQSVQEAAGGNEKLQQAFKDLGVFVTDANGKIRPTGDILQDITEKAQRGEITQKAYAAAVDILGKNINKLELSKLNALRDPVKDADIKRLDEYNDALDKVRDKLSRGIISFFGSIAKEINEASEAADRFSAKLMANETRLNQIGKTSRLPGRQEQFLPLPGTPEQYPPRPDFEREMSKREKLLYAEQQRIKKLDELMKSYKSRAGVGREGDESGRGGFGETPEATKQAILNSEKKIAASKAEINKSNLLRLNSERLDAILQFASQQEAIEFKSAADIKAININTKAEIAKARLDIFAQEKLSEAQKEAEFNAKRKELSIKSEADIAAARTRASEALKREDERIRDLITQSKARVDEEQRLNDLIDQRTFFNIANADATDKERQRAEALFNLEEDRLKTLRQIALIKDLPPTERAAREKEINDIYDKRKILTQNQQAADVAQQQSFSAGFNKAYNQYIEDSKNAFETAGRLSNKFTSGLEDYFVNAMKNVKGSWKDFVASMLEELVRSQLRQMMASLFNFGASKTGGQGGSFLGSLLGFANGGIIPTNNPVLVGERGPEILAGASGRTVIPNSSLGGSNVTYNINAVDAMSFKQMVARDPGFIHAVAMQGGKTTPVRR
jgi:hypothetical protein